MKFFEDFVCVLQMILLTKIKTLDVGTGAPQQNRKSTRDKANISNPKVNDGCAPLSAYRSSADCVQISIGPSISCVPLRVYRTGEFHAMWTSLIAPWISNDIHREASDRIIYPFPNFNGATIEIW